ncbi:MULTISPECIES: hypothetical protein [Bacillus cereus group]|uniref:hypothetical protein n=1 Tax=Bacillus cereus group TaxID=86661 RepID=UPI000BED6A80|nr:MULTISPECIES: hypothetical protein [Bacillus cereus group]PEF88583.1 hypothetical protein CON51_05100 [Bacillus thuringiensis]PES54760.1 hypothetical protein CN506_19900 [Bacillus thuringiensis]PFP03549.1 hypothetical protein COJ91_22425 [Bacillus thuringiensis]PFS55716.1 hypothetical protein COK64_23510 [Bacillus thuringiensis]PGL62368.1 hypothetical protein CN939_19675 [Bacillus thuringiensis]
MLVQLFEPTPKLVPLQYGDIIEITFSEHSTVHKGTSYYIATYNDDLTNMDGGVRYDGKCSNLEQVRTMLNNDINVGSWRVLSKSEYTVQIHKNAGAE